MAAKLPDFQKRLTTPEDHSPAQDQRQAKFNREVREAVQKLNENSDYELVDITITTSPTRVTHKLGRQWRGWSVWDRDADARIWRVATPAGEPSDDSKYIYFQASATVTARIKII